MWVSLEVMIKFRARFRVRFRVGVRLGGSGPGLDEAQAQAHLFGWYEACLPRLPFGMAQQ